MTPARAFLALGLAAWLAAPPSALALSLPEAIALAKRNNPALAQSRAQAEGADARLAQARAARLPSLTLSADAGEGTTDLGGFFGFRSADVSPRGAALEVRQPLFTGGGATAAITRAREAREAALAQVAGDRALLAAQAAEAYVAVLSAGEILRLNEAHVRQTGEIARQAELRFRGGEVPRTDVAQALARQAGARADLARASGDVARSRARFLSVVGAPPEGLEPLPSPPATPASLDEALARAERTSPLLLAAAAASRAADAGVRYAQAERLPNVALAATASTTRDRFFPGYRADDLTIGIQGRWTLFAGGAINGRVDEARAGARGARAALDTTRAQVREAVIGAWEEVETLRAVMGAAADQATAAASALDSVRNEVRVGQKPALDLLDAEREALAAQSALVAARGGAVAAAYRLNALLQGD
ncbi:MAG: TolC family outer membrane protein [Phenylobacterium sp.]|uniref:TolC family outer membrane protein n=1 Tax=Phenylobacterium sp. TaxID=1871053 RepID=UPI001A22F6C0|nr:TolC family outer membrane protein [Phenylobacterium sp.]MBJ7408743.1 TolC family outer membrane protein [Phenylobacterium sp.]